MMRYEIRELNLGGVLDQTISLIKDHFGLFFSIVGVSLVPLLAIQSVVQLTVMPEPPTEFTLESLQAYQAAQQQAMSQNFALVMGSTLLSIIILPLANAAIVKAVAATYLSRPITMGDAIGQAFGVIGSLYWTWLLVFAAIMGGLILLIIPGILAAFWFSLATQVVVIERISGFAAMKRSKALMSGNIGRIFALGLVLGAIGIGIQMVAGMIPQRHAEAAAGVLIGAVLTIFNSTAMVVFYFSARCRHEQFDLQLLADNMQLSHDGPSPDAGLPDYSS